MRSTAIALRRARVDYGRRVALSDVDLDLPEGSVTAMIGPNGSGKSTLLGLVSGLIQPTTGTVTVLGVPAARIGARLAFVPQQTEANRLLPVTTREVVTMARYAHRGALRPLRAADRAAVAEAMERMEITDLAARHLSRLSGGQRQRVLVAQGLAQEADVLLLDEPVTGLDLVSQQLILDAMGAQRDAGRTVLLTTHDLADAQRADVVVLLANRVVAVGPPAEVLQPDLLREGYGRRVTAVDGEVVLDDDHGHHGHTHRYAPGPHAHVHEHLHEPDGPSA